MLNTFYQSSFPNLTLNSQYLLREQSPTDCKDFFNYYKDPKVGRYILATKPTTLEEAKSEINYCRRLFYDKKGIFWSISTKKSQKMIGSVGLLINNQHRRGEICYDLSSEYWQQGIMTQALTVVIKHAFNNMGLGRIEALIVKENTASVALLSKLGFQREGALRQYRHYQGKFHDVEIYAITSPVQRSTQPQANFHAMLQQALSTH